MQLSLVTKVHKIWMFLPKHGYSEFNDLNMALVRKRAEVTSNIDTCDETSSGSLVVKRKKLKNRVSVTQSGQIKQANAGNTVSHVFRMLVILKTLQGHHFQ